MAQKDKNSNIGYNRDEIITNLVLQIVARLKLIPSDNAPDDLNLDGSVFEEVAYQIQNGESVFWDLYEDIIISECENAYNALDEKQQDVLVDDYVYYDEDSSKEEIQIEKDNAMMDVIKEIKEAVLSFAADYELVADE